MPNPDLASERRAFEADYRRALKMPHKNFAWRVDHYYWPNVEARWQGWLARSAVPIAPVPACTICHCHEKARAFLGDQTIGVSFPPSCEHCGVPMALGFCSCLTAALSVSSGAKDG